MSEDISDQVYTIQDGEITQEKQQEAIWRGIKSRLEASGIIHEAKHVDGIIAVTNILWDRGWRNSYLEVVNWICHEGQRAHVLQYGLEEFLHMMLTRNMGPIRRKKLPGRNDPCSCGSGKKYKSCCISIHQ